MNYKINPAKATCENLGFGDGIQAVNENCFGICAAFSGTEDTFEMDPQCVKSCEELVEKKRREMFGVGRCDHQAPYRAVFWGQVPRFIPTLLKQGYDLDTAKTMCNKMCEESSLVNECRQKCKLDSDAVMVDNIESKVENKNIEKYEKASNCPYSNTKPEIHSGTTIKSESDSNKVERSPTLTILLIFIAIIVILILISFVKKRK
jgi:hypothetical protein